MALLPTVMALQTNEYVACWNVTLVDESLFCYGVAIHGPIDDETYYNAKDYDDRARTRYDALRIKWQERASEKDEPTNDCLAVARQIFCSAAFRRCRDYEAPKQPLCPFVCNLFKKR